MTVLEGARAHRALRVATWVHVAMIALSILNVLSLGATLTAPPPPAIEIGFWRYGVPLLNLGLGALLLRSVLVVATTSRPVPRGWVALSVLALVVPTIALSLQLHFEWLWEALWPFPVAQLLFAIPWSLTLVASARARDELTMHKRVESCRLLAIAGPLLALLAVALTAEAPWGWRLFFAGLPMSAGNLSLALACHELGEHLRDDGGLPQARLAKR